MRALLDAVHDAFHRPELRSHSVLHGILWVLIAASVLLVVVELFVPMPADVMAALDAVDVVLLSIFWIELILRVGTHRPPAVAFFKHSRARRLSHQVWGRIRYCLTPLILIDIVTVLAVVPALRGLRIFRLLRLLHGTPLLRYSSPLQGTARAFAENRLLYLGAFSLLGSATVLGGISLWAFEREAEGTHVASLADGVWWAIVTLTTVGYGDISPVTPQGKVIGAALMVSGMFLLALFAGIVGQTLLSSVLTLREEAFRMTDFTGHILICGYDPGARMLLEAVEREVGETTREIVVFAPGERPRDLPPRFAWVAGDPTKESELGKVRITHAESAIVVGCRAVGPQQADATTILTLFTLRSFLGHNPIAARREVPLYVVAEILDAENVAHARAAGADEVIETTRLGFSLLAHAVTMPGTAAIMSTVAAAGAHSLYVGRPPDGVNLPARFADLAAAVRQSHPVLLIGLRDPEGQDQVNPDDDEVVTGAHGLLYLAEAAVLPPR